MDVQTFELPTNHVHLWIVHFKSICGTHLLREDFLSEEEKSRRNHFVKHELKENFFSAHAILKLLLAKYLQVEPSKVNYKYGLYHKPFVCFKGKTLVFNMSHSNEWAAYAFSRENSVGVDIEECHTEISSVFELCHLICNEEEQKRLHAMTCSEKRKAYFLQIWTAREAFLKMLGVGIGDYLSSIHFDEYWNAFLPGMRDPNRQGYMMTGKIQHILHERYIVSIACSRSTDRMIERKLHDIADLAFQ